MCLNSVGPIVRELSKVLKPFQSLIASGFWLYSLSHIELSNVNESVFNILSSEYRDFLS